MDEITATAFWRTYSPLSRFGWTTAALVPMWALFAVLLALMLIFAAAIGLAYPLVHYMWGMKSSHSASDNPSGAEAGKSRGEQTEG